MTDILAPWAPAEHPRDTVSGRFAGKSRTAPETTLVVAVPVHLLPAHDCPAPTEAPTQITTEVPWHLRTDLRPKSEADNPLLVAFRHHQAEFGDTAEQWSLAINEYFDADETVEDPEIFSGVLAVIGTPRNEGDVNHWHARTAAWRDHAIDLLAADTAARGVESLAGGPHEHKS